MLAFERRSQILSEIESLGSVLVADLAKKYDVTEETIRRDLEKLENEGLVKKTYGGAVLAENISADPSYRIRAKTNEAEKLIVAEKVFDLVENGENIMLDASSTCVFIARKLKEKQRLTIITNSVEILLECADCENLNLIATGGTLRGSSLSLLGLDAVRTIGKFTVDKAIISCKGLGLDKGVMESNVDEAEIKKAMVNSAKQLILAVDSSKFNKLSFAKSLDLRRVNAVVADSAPPEWIAHFEKNEIKFV